MRSPHPIRPEHLALLPAIVAAAERHGLDAAVFAALVEHESEGEKDPAHPVPRHEPTYRWLWPRGMDAYGLSDDELAFQRHSWGPAQVMGAVLRELGYTGSGPELLDDPARAIGYGAEYLSRCLHGAGGLYVVACARYNAGGRGELTRRGQEYTDGVVAGVCRWRELVDAVP